MAHIETVHPDDATGPLRAIYDAARQRAGKVYEILRIQSLRPEVLATFVRLYRQVMFAPSGLSRIEREMVAVVVSETNGCRY
jgi:uncharacterized peroxidase-related enzyme